ncbi:MAG: aminotransferase class I/II-fold pyridoxal phosphate-dependent enzyme [Bacteroidia bacterium]|nr:aminotransferase class I/II-fold pyridoxal phosphate-dependent enzyme [Bacteroidia bacterium]
MSNHFETKAIHNQLNKTENKENSSPLYLTSSFVFDDAEEMRATFAEEKEGFIYSRFSNPNSFEFIQKMCALEGTEDGMATASGMAAVFASFMALMKSGDHLLCCASVFGSTHNIISKYLPKYGIEHSYFDVNKPETWESFFKPNTKMVYIETPTNPGVDIIDLEFLGKLCKKHNVIFNVDNCFATPYLQQPLKYGADIIIHSATKYIDGQGRVLGGCALGKKELIKEIYLFIRNTGASLSPFNAWVLSKSLETLAVRMDRHCDNAFVLAKALEKNEEIEFIKYPFLESHPQHAVAKKQMSKGGGIVTFELKGGPDSNRDERGRKFLDALQLCTLTANLGDTKTIATHPASTTHSRLSEEERLEVGITPGLIRISAGLEHHEDIVNDVVGAIEKSR